MPNFWPLEHDYFEGKIVYLRKSKAEVNPDRI